MTDNSPNDDQSRFGRTWADLFSSFPVWLFSLAAVAVIGLMIHATFFATRSVDYGVLGTWGPSSETSAGSSLPVGAVIAFDSDLKSEAGCPTDWMFFEPAGGRFILGAGDHDNVWYPEGSEVPKRLGIYPTYHQDARAGIQETIGARATGGEETHTLTTSELPEHSHTMLWGRTDTEAEGRRAVGNDIKGSLPARDIQSTLSTGDDEPHNNMPPYIALYFCKKV